MVIGNDHCSTPRLGVTDPDTTNKPTAGIRIWKSRNNMGYVIVSPYDSLSFGEFVERASRPRSNAKCRIYE